MLDNYKVAEKKMQVATRKGFFAYCIYLPAYHKFDKLIS